MICQLYFALAILLGCGSDEPPQPMPTPPPIDQRIRESSDGKSMWEWKWEQMTGESFDREDRELAEKDDLVWPKPEKIGPKCPRGFVNDDGDFIPFSAERRAACEEN